MGIANKDLLNLELKNSTSSSLDSTLLVFPKKDLPPQSSTSGEKLVTSSIPKSQVLGKVRDFLGVMAEANKKLQTDAKENSGKDYDIEALTGNEKEYIEMDLIVGVADLHTPEAVAAAESALVGSQQVINLAGTGSGSDTESSEDEDEEMTETGAEDSKSQKAGSPSNGQRKKRPNIIELL
ncbi:hypothetical protein C5167_024445 [Papaver somniferum]|uniref:Uncharacterized protein n=1 Tax=Papaver somniferum TaxID=3469 RepID=A0A4Y7JRW9_PAPSO|nr:uncharacterized protein LOC113278035 [Papaver somniferum]RZC62691.1 hypothetical protein C5167_024445 [Papaver somniferum]